MVKNAYTFIYIYIIYIYIYISKRKVIMLWNAKACGMQMQKLMSRGDSFMASR